MNSPTLMQNAMKDKIRRGEVALGVSLMFPCPQLVEMLAYAGFDWVLIDCEHGSIGPTDIEVMSMAADAAGITAIARPRSNAAADIQFVLDRGVLGVQIPHINTRADAERAVAAVKFGPGAARGLAAGTRPDRWGLGGHMPDFTAHANAQSFVCVQIEHQEAIANIDEILKVDGIDVFFIGPSDLSQSMGYPCNPAATPVATAVEKTLASIRAAGKAPGMPATTETLETAIRNGCRYIYKHLPRVLGAGAKEFLTKARTGNLPMGRG
jgi:2-keto-3-deoxy-L-rhamnonate aldolase RhmA